MQARCGYIHTEPRDHDKRWSDYVGSLPELVSGEDIDHREHLPPVWQQLAEDCTGISTRTAAYATAHAAGQPIPLPSGAFIYAVARLRMGPPPLKDEGASLTALFDGMRETGLVSEERWPEDPATINDVPPVDALEAGQGARIAEWYWIPGATGMGDALISALRRLRFPVLAMPVDEAFANIGDRVYASQGGAVLGGHAMVVVGYRAALDAFIVRNSWGLDFGDAGDVLIARAILERIAAGAWVIDVTPGGAP